LGEFNDLGVPGDSTGVLESRFTFLVERADAMPDVDSAEEGEAVAEGGAEVFDVLKNLLKGGPGTTDL
jgi:hypothetical protein